MSQHEKKEEELTPSALAEIDSHAHKMIQDGTLDVNLAYMAEVRKAVKEKRDIPTKEEYLETTGSGAGHDPRPESPRHAETDVPQEGPGDENDPEVADEIDEILRSDEEGGNDVHEEWSLEVTKTDQRRDTPTPPTLDTKNVKHSPTAVKSAVVPELSESEEPSHPAVGIFGHTTSSAYHSASLRNPAISRIYDEQLKETTLMKDVTTLKKVVDRQQEVIQAQRRELDDLNAWMKSSKVSLASMLKMCQETTERIDHFDKVSLSVLNSAADLIRERVPENPDLVKNLEMEAKSTEKAVKARQETSAAAQPVVKKQKKKLFNFA